MGRLVGAFYDRDGNPTALSRRIEQQLAQGGAAALAAAAAGEAAGGGGGEASASLTPCNVKWSKREGESRSRVAWGGTGRRRGWERCLVMAYRQR